MRFLRGRVPAAVISAVVVAGLVGLATVAIGTAGPAVAFAQSGHWVFNRTESAVVHVDSGTRAVDARVAVPEAGEDTAFAVQGSTQGFIVGRRNITVFGKSTLTVETTIPSGQDELPVGIETVGGPYLVYKQAGTIVRLGVPPTTIPVGGPVSRPVHSDDGTIWVHRADNGDICSLTATATELDCGVGTPAGTPGALAITQAAAGFVDTSTDAVGLVQGAGLLPPVSLGTDLPDGALIADRDSENRLPVVTAGPNRLVLTDDGGVTAGRPGAAPIVVELGSGDFSGPVAADGVVALIDLTRHRLLTFTMDGRPLGTADLPPGDGEPTITRGGDGRLYVDGASGAHTHVVGDDGSITSVSTAAPAYAVVSAQPDALAAVVPTPPVWQPRSGDGPTVVHPDGDPIPDQGEEWTPTEGDRDTPDPEPVVETPPTPRNVLARVTDGGVTLTWTGGGEGVTYTVAGGGEEWSGAGTTTEFDGLEPGESYTFTVVAANAGGRSDAARSNTVTLPGGPPGAVTGLALDGRGQGARTRIVTAGWEQPDFNGGAFEHYVVRATDRDGEVVYNQTTTAQNVGDIRGDVCGSPFTVTVSAVTRQPGGGTLTGPAATAQDEEYDCSWNATISGAATGPQAMSVRITVNPGSFVYAGPECYLTVDGETRWRGNCGSGTGPLAVNGLEPGTAYTVILHVNQLSGERSQSNTITVTTPGGGGGNGADDGEPAGDEGGG